MVGFADDRGRQTIFDGWLLGFRAPTRDARQNIADPSITVEDGIVTMDFKKKRVTNDDKVRPLCNTKKFDIY